MFFQRIKTPGIAHVAYIIADGGRAVVVDPRRDVDEYLAVLKDNDLSLEYVIETHRQEDFEMGSAALRSLTGAQVVTGDHACFGHSDIRLKDGDELTMAGLTFRALHTPGHTPESVCWAVYHDAYKDKAWGVLTGDSLFIGDAGRTDLPDPDKTAENAGLLYDALHAKILPLGDQALVLPAHGAGTVCGGNVANRDHATLGLEKIANSAFTMDRDAFVRHRLADRIPRPPYFDLMEEVNLDGGRPVALRGTDVRVLQPKDFAAACERAAVIDTRLPEAFAGGHIPRSYSIWLSGLAMFGGWVVSDDDGILLVVDGTEELDAAVSYLTRLGRDRIKGVLAGGFEAWRDAGLPVEQSGTITPKQLAADRGDYVVLDVREISEFEAGHIPDARHMYVGYLESRLGDLGLDTSDRIVVTCSVGHRAGLGVSILKRHGYEHVYNLLGGMTAWKTLGQEAAVLG
ncbi:MAG: MBL fold metallo-hydrolase [Rhodospirillales bacterium]|nr:MBL fold metallo-hydrolase [Rhodospirillales bacterium]